MKHLFIIIGLFLFSQVDAKKKYYKWVDVDGNTHYSEKKSSSQQNQEVKVYSDTPSSPVRKKEKETTETGAKEKSAEQKAVEEFNKREEERVQKLQNRENCKIAKKNLETLKKTTNVKRKNPATGEIIYMGNKERTKMLKNTKKSVKELCK